MTAITTITTTVASTSYTITKAPILRSFPQSHFKSLTLNSIFCSLKFRNSLAFCPHAVVSGRAQGPYTDQITSSTLDPELRSVLELATDSELYELERILFGPSYFSPLLKSIAKPVHVDYFMIGEDLKEREDFIEALESRFLFLAADAQSTLRGRRPSYRDILLGVRGKLNIRCSRNLATEDLEVEIFLHLLQEYSCHESGTSATSKTSSTENSLEFGLDQWKVQAVAAVKLGAVKINETFLKGGGMLALVNISRVLARKLSESMLFEAANYQIWKEIMSKGGQLAAVNLESRAALLVAKQGVTGAAARYLGFRSMLTFVGPMLWGTFLADVVIQMLGTDYARLLRAIYAIAQIRIIRTCR